MRAFGHLRDPAGCGIGQEIGHLVGVSPTFPPRWDLSAMVEDVIDQRGQSCVGAALSGAIELAAHIQGWGLDSSYLAIYSLARMLQSPGADALPDTGCYPYRAIEGLQDWGVVSRHRWPDMSPLEGPVPVDVLEAGAIAMVTGIYRIDGDGRARARDARAALSQGHPVVFGMQVDAAYESGPGALYEGLNGPALGGHAQCIVGYDVGRFKAVNSWGPRWNGNGFAWLAEDFLCGENCFDFYVITSAPREVR